jgi:iron complex transport system substrate-binding protein
MVDELATQGANHAAPEWQRRRFLTAVLATGLAPDLLARTRSVTDDAGRKVTLPAQVQRIFCAGAPASILMFALAPERLAGWTTPFLPAERPFIPDKYMDLPVTGRLTGRGNSANIESVLAIKPDLILDYGTVNPTYASLADRTQKQSGIPTLLLDGRFDRIPETFTRLGDILGNPALSAEWARYATATLAEIDSRVARIAATQRPKVYYARGPRGLNTARPGSINVETLERLGAVNAANELGPGGLTNVSMEQVLKWNPEVIVTVDANFHQSVWRDPLWSSVAAVRAGRVHLAPGLPFGWVDFPPSINRLIGLRWLARALYPREFPEDLRGAVRDFYSRAYHRTPSDTQIDALLAVPRR